MSGTVMPSPTLPNPFHAGELQAQALAGGGPPGAAIRDFMPEQHRRFFTSLQFMLLATSEPDGAPAADVVTGPEGFVASPDERSLRIRASAGMFGPDGCSLRLDQPVGLLGIDFRTRRRNRVNGIVAATNENEFLVSVRQSFGNCPKYIQVRELQELSASGSMVAPAVRLTALDQAARDLISSSATFFVATASGLQAGASGGADISHRGGAPGFVGVGGGDSSGGVGGDTLTIPDFRGNRYFNTLGNMLLEPRAALLFIDFESGDVLQLQGRTEIFWSPDDASDLAGAERLWRFHVERGWRKSAAFPLRTFG